MKTTIRLIASALLFLTAGMAAAQDMPPDVKSLLAKASGGQQLSPQELQRVQDWSKGVVKSAGKPPAGGERRGEGNKPASDPSSNSSKGSSGRHDGADPLATLVPGSGNANNKKPGNDGTKDVEDPGAFEFRWLTGEPPQSICVGDRFALDFVIEAIPPRVAAPVATLVAGTMDATARLGSVTPNHWSLDGLLNVPPKHGGGLEYFAAKEGTEDLTLTYRFDGKMAVKHIAFRVEQCGYRLAFELERHINSQHGKSVVEAFTKMHGDGGFQIRKSLDPATPSTVLGFGMMQVESGWGNHAPGVIYKEITPGKGEGFFGIEGIVEPNGDLLLYLKPSPIQLSAPTTTAGTKKYVRDIVMPALPDANWKPKNLSNLVFPGGVGTKKFDGPAEFETITVPSGMKVTETGHVTVKLPDNEVLAPLKP